MLCPHCKKTRNHYKKGLCAFCYEDIYIDKPTLPQVINQDFINELKLRGKKEEISKLLKTFQENIRQEKKTELKYFNKRVIQIKKTQGYCSNMWCNNLTDGKFLQCERCRKRQKKYAKKCLKGLK